MTAGSRVTNHMQTPSMNGPNKIGESLIESVAGMFSAEETLRRIPHGLEWGRAGGRQRLWWDDPVEAASDRPALVRIHIVTEFIGLPSEPGDWPKQLRDDLLMISGASLWGGLMFKEEMEGSLCLGCAVSAHEGNVGYLPLVLFRAMAAQAAVREALFASEIAPGLSEFPGSETAGDMQELAESIQLMLSSADSERPVGVDADMAFLTEQFQEFPCLMCNGDEAGLSAEFPFGKETSLLRIDTAAEHPIFGPAISLVLLLPLDGEESALSMKAVLEMNRKEQPDHDMPWTFGSWTLDQQMTPRLGYRIWIPYALFQQNLLVNLGIGMATRARHCCERIAGMSFDDAYPLAQEQMMIRLEQLLGMMEDDDDQ